MANNTILNPGTGGDTVQTIDNTTYKTQVVAIADSTGANRVAVNASGQAPVIVAAALPAGTALIGKVGVDQTTPGTTNAVALAQIGSTTVVTGGVSGTLGVGGVTAAAATATGNPLRVGAIGRTANPTAVTDGQVSNVMTDDVGRLVVVSSHARDLVGIQQTTITSSTTETTIVTAIASTFCDLTHLSITNGSATATIVTLKDSTTGTTRAIWNLAAGGGVVVNYDPPIPQATINTNWTLTCGTSVASVYVNAVYVKNV